jgi:hypothetical protein
MVIVDLTSGWFTTCTKTLQPSAGNVRHAASLKPRLWSQ